MKGRLALAAPLALACTCGPGEDVLGAFRAAREAALAQPPPVVEPFAPDLRLHLSEALLARLVELGLEGHERIRGKVDAPGGVVLRPDLRVKRVDVVPAAPRSCEGCIGATVRLAGEVAYESGIAGKGTVPLTIDATLDLGLVTAAAAEGWTVSARPERVRKVSLELEALPKALVELADGPLKRLAQDHLEELEPYELLAIGSAGLPIRALRVEPAGGTIRVAMLSDASHPGVLPDREPRVDADWLLEAAPDSIVWIARREAFELGPQAYGVVAVPERFALAGDRFDLALRLWRTEPPGWWRDYSATGTVAVQRGKIRLSAEDVQEGSKSAGAALADPLALLAEGAIVDGIADALQQAVPASERRKAGAWKVDVEVSRVGGEAGVIEVAGSLAVTPR